MQPALERCTKWAPVQVKAQEAPGKFPAARAQPSYKSPPASGAVVITLTLLEFHRTHYHGAVPPEMLAPWVIKQVLPSILDNSVNTFVIS